MISWSSTYVVCLDAVQLDASHIPANKFWRGLKCHQWLVCWCQRVYGVNSFQFFCMACMSSWHTSHLPDVCLQTCLFLSACLSPIHCPSVWLSICLTVHLSDCSSVWLSICLIVHLSHFNGLAKCSSGLTFLGTLSLTDWNFEGMISFQCVDIPGIFFMGLRSQSAGLCVVRQVCKGNIWSLSVMALGCSQLKYSVCTVFPIVGPPHQLEQEPW